MVCPRRSSRSGVGGGRGGWGRHMAQDGTRSYQQVNESRNEKAGERNGERGNGRMASLQLVSHVMVSMQPSHTKEPMVL